MSAVKQLASDPGEAAACFRVKMAGSKTVKFTQDDLDMIEAATAYFDWVQESDLLRTAIRVGLESLKEDPSPLGKRPLSPDVFKRAASNDPTPPMGDFPPGTKKGSAKKDTRPAAKRPASAT